MRTIIPKKPNNPPRPINNTGINTLKKVIKTIKTTTTTTIANPRPYFQRSLKSPYLPHLNFTVFA